jgi:hypothetical protein
MAMIEDLEAVVTWLSTVTLRLVTSIAVSTKKPEAENGDRKEKAKRR